ncbi:MAG: DNA adenine methylase [Chitinispirillia bacterium]|nr:DNA adenine methylase [Chitinispirillia bacterium]
MNSPLCYVGGKSQLSKIIIDAMPVHTTYVEVFAGAAWVFFRKEPSKVEIINDFDKELVSFYRVLQNHLEEFMRQFKWLLVSRELFEDAKRQLEADGLTDIQRAARYYYVQRQCFGGKIKGRTFGVAIDRPPRINLLRMEEELSEVHLRLSRVMVENLDWSELVRRYDKPATLFYLDPPYHKMPYYRHNFVEADFFKLAKQLDGVQGKFIMSLNDNEFIRETFKSFNIRTVKLKYSITNNTKSKDGTEVLITNF